MTLKRLTATPRPATGRLIITADGVLDDPPEYAVVQGAFLALWSMPQAPAGRPGAIKVYCRARRCRRTAGRPCLGHEDTDSIADARVGDLFVIGTPERPGRALYELIGRHDWATYRLERKA